MKGLSVFWTRMTVELLPMSLYTHTLRVLPIHFGRETVPSARNHYDCAVLAKAVFLYADFNNFMKKVRVTLFKC